MKKTLLRILFLWGLISVFLTGTASAGGLYIQEIATPSLGTANAGAQAWADSPDNGPQDWGARLQLTFLFPEK